MTPVAARPAIADRACDDRVRALVALHFDPVEGAPFWIDRAARLGIDPLRQIRCFGDLALLGEMTPADLKERPLFDYLPRAIRSRPERLILGQTGGATGEGAWTAYRDDEFEAAFVTPFLEAAAHVGFPAGEVWLYVGPSGPHIIAKAARRLATATGSADPFSVDFDPRWARKLPTGSFAQQRYIQHIVEQAMAVIDGQPVGVLFTTPVILDQLGRAMTDAQRDRIRGVHYGGMELAAETLSRFQQEVFPRAVHLSGYGNTLFGCCLELSVAPGRRLDYYPAGERLRLEIVDDRGAVLPPGTTGRVRFTRLDESLLIVRCRERDEAESVEPPAHAPPAFGGIGVRDPRTSPTYAPGAVKGIY